jgi:hypothetical protein
MIELGLLLNACHLLDGFPSVFHRLINENEHRSAYSELVVVATLQRLGHPARFEPPLEGKVLDALCEVGEDRVYIEVVAPEQPEAATEQQDRVDRLTAEVTSRISRCRVEIEIYSEITTESMVAIAAAIETAEPSTWTLVESLARLRRVDAGQPLPPTFDGDGAHVTICGEETIQGESTSIAVRWESSDARAKRVFNEEYHQFSHTVPNVLVVNVTGVSDGMMVWPAEMARLLQPTRNRKVGAVAFFQEGIVGPPDGVCRRWRVLVNPHAHHPVPEVLVSGFESLDESPAFSLPRPKRIIAT